MNHLQRLEACISNGKIDRTPVALWRHFPVDDQHPGHLANSILHFQDTYDFDLIKITPASSYCVKDYGVMDVWKGNPEGTREYVYYPVKQPGDWKKLPTLSPFQGHLANQLECIRQVITNSNARIPTIQTIFDPLSQAKNLVGKETLLVHMRQHPEELLTGLEILTRNTLTFLKECIKLGIDGVFFAVQHLQASLLSRREVEQFLQPFDDIILEAAQSLWLNVAHFHGSNLYFDLAPKRGISVINWHDLETPPSLEEAKQGFAGAVCGGLRQWDTLVYGTPLDVKQEATTALESTGGERFILGTGCVLPVIAPHSNILEVRNSVEGNR